MLNIVRVITVLSLFAGSASSDSGGLVPHNVRIGVDATIVALNVINTSPALPLLYYEKGDYRISAQPTFFSGKVDETDSNQTNTGDFRGWAGAGSFSYGLSRRWGLITSISGAQIFDSSFHDISPGGYTRDSLDVMARMMSVSVGAVRQFFGQKENSFTLPVFFGFQVAQIGYSQTIRAKDGSGVLRYDAEMEGKTSGVRPFFGVMGEIPIGLAFSLVPFIFINRGLNHPSMEITAIRTNKGGNPDDIAAIKESPYLNSRSPGPIAGLNLIFKPWGLSINLTGALRSEALSSAQGVKMTKLSVSKWLRSN